FCIDLFAPGLECRPDVFPSVGPGRGRPSIPPPPRCGSRRTRWGAAVSTSQRARRASRSGSRISTLLPSSRSQPRCAKSASALLTVSREAPTYCAISSCVRSCVTRSRPASCEPKRWASCSSALATRPGTSVKISSATMLLVRRRRRATTRSSCSAISGRVEIHWRSAGRSMVTARTSVTVVAVEVRGPGSKMDNSPNMSAGPKMPSRFSLPSADLRRIFTFPDRMLYSLSPGSPSWKMTWPRGNSTLSNVCASASAAAGSTPWKMPARARTSSTSCLLSHATFAQLMDRVADRSVQILSTGGEGAPTHRVHRRCACLLTAGADPRSAAAETTQPEQLKSPADALLVKRFHLVRLRRLEELLDVRLPHGDVGELALHPFHEQGEEENDQRYGDHEPVSHIGQSSLTASESGRQPALLGVLWRLLAVVPAPRSGWSPGSAGVRAAGAPWTPPACATGSSPVGYPGALRS